MAMKILTVLLVRGVSHPEPPTEVKTWVMIGCGAVVALLFWYFVFYKEE